MGCYEAALMDFLELIGRYIAERYVRFEEGSIWVGKERISFNFLPSAAREFMINSKLDPERYPAAQFLAAKRQGYDFVHQHGIPLVKDWTPIVKTGFEWMRLFGGGSFRSMRADNEGVFVVATGKATFGMEIKAEMPDNQEPVDYVTGGLIAGVLQYYAKEHRTYSVETSCVAQKGVQECTHVSGTRDKVMDYVERFSPDRIDWARKALGRTEKLEKEIKEKKWEDLIV